jgi:glycerol-3-phosphate cytidylyltransferase
MIKSNKKYKLGYTSGVFDLFHIGHLNILKKAKEECEYLIVAVSTDELVKSYKKKTPIIEFSERLAIVEAIKYVDKVIPQESRDKMAAYEKYKFDVMFVGDDWRGKPLWKKLEQDLSEKDSTVSYIPYTKKVSSTLLKEVLIKLNK